MRPRRPPLFIDLDETLIHASENSQRLRPTRAGSQRIGEYDVWLRPDAHELLRLCRDGGREVFLFTNAFFGFALAASERFDLGFDDRTIFSLAMILNCRRGISPYSALIDNQPPNAEPTREKMRALGILPGQVWTIPAFEPPKWPAARLFLLGLPLRLARLDVDCSGSMVSREPTAGSGQLIVPCPDGRTRCDKPLGER